MPSSVRAFSFNHDKGCDWTTVASLHFKDDLIGLLDCSFEYQADQSLSIVGTQGHIKCDLPFGSYHDISLSLKTPNEFQTLSLPPTNRYISCIQDFHDKISHQKFTPSPARDAIANLKILDAIAQASQTGQEVSL